MQEQGGRPGCRMPAQTSFGRGRLAGVAIFFLLTTLPLCLIAQRYPFFNRGIEHGLVQSQPLMLSQDSARYLWAATLGGVSRYDGRQFVSYTRTEGLPSNTAFAIYTDSRGHVWVGTDAGLARFDGQGFTREWPGGTEHYRAVMAITEAPNGQLYFRSGDRLYMRLSPGQFQEVDIVPGVADSLISLDRDRQGRLWAGVHHRGLYQLQPDGSWQQQLPFAGLPAGSMVRELFFGSCGDTLVISSSGLYRWLSGRFSRYGADQVFGLKFYDIEEDADGSFWLAAAGTWRVAEGRATYFGRREGFTDNMVYHIFRDAEDNIWWGTDGEGIFRYSHLPLQFFDTEAGLDDPSVMGICQRGDTYYIGSRTQGIYRLQHQKLERFALPNDCQRINSLQTDQRGRVWVGTHGNGLHYFDPDEQLKTVVLGQANLRSTVTDLLFEAGGKVWVATQRGLYQGDRDQATPWTAVSDLFVNTIEFYGPDSLLLGTPRGVFVISKTSGQGRELRLNGYERPLVVCSGAAGDTYYLGTADFGVLIFHRGSQQAQSITRADGLPSNFIYNLLVEPGQLWLGTGAGISRLAIDKDGSWQKPFNYGIDEGLGGLESNHSVALLDDAGARWFGFTRGLVRFGPKAALPSPADKVAPLINLEAIQLFFTPIRDSSYFERLHATTGLPLGLRLPPRQNHLTFQFSGLYLRAPRQVVYHYRLRGLEKDFLSTTASSVTYSSLPPGDYTFEAYASTQSGLSSDNRIVYPFTIKAPLHQQLGFRLMVIIVFIGLLALLQYVRQRALEQRRLRLEAVRTEAFNRLRRRTAEDFHDEMGNKLTRIAILSDILKTKLRNDAGDTHQLLDQIKDNVSALHRGSKDIIWSLQPEHDDLQTVVEHVRDIGSELFSETTIDFQYQQSGHGSSTALPLDYSRHLQMIAKEIYNNILKHAQATRVELLFDTGLNGHHHLTFRDNGRGFCLQGHKPGNGLRNLHNRAERLGASIAVQTEPGGGTQIALTLPPPPQP